MRYGVTFAYFQRNSHCDLSRMIPIVAGLGFDLLEIDSSQLLGMDGGQLAALQRLAADHQLELIHSFNLGVQTDISSKDASIRENGISYVCRILGQVAKVGGNCIGGINYVGWNCFEEQIDPQKRWDNSVASMFKIANVAADYGIRYNLEVTNSYEQPLLNTAEQARRYCREVGVSGLGILLDVNHMIIEEDSFSQAILTAGPLLSHFHVAENNRKVPVGRGFLPWQEMKAALDKIGYNNTITLEPLVLSGGEIGRNARIWRDKCLDDRPEGLAAELKEGLVFIKGVFG